MSQYCPQNPNTVRRIGGKSSDLLPPGLPPTDALVFVRYLAGQCHLQEIHFLWRPFLPDTMKPLLGDCRDDKIAAKLPAQQNGHFHLVREGAAKPFHADRSFLKTEQLSEEDILRLARPKLSVGH